MRCHASGVYYFKSETVAAMRRELSTFVKEFSQLHGDTLEELLGGMDYYLKWCNAHNPRAVPYLNWTPQFGCLVQQYQPNAPIAPMHEYRIPCYMTGVIPHYNTTNLSLEFFTKSGIISQNLGEVQQTVQQYR